MTSNHRLTFSGRYNDFNSTPDFLNSAESRFPGFPNLAGQVSGRYMWQGTVRSTLGKSMINEVRVGGQDGTGLGTYFGQGVDSSQFNCPGLGCQSAGGQGWDFNFPGATTGSYVSGAALTGATAYGGQSASVAAQFSVEDNFTWLKGAHSISAGGNFCQDLRAELVVDPYNATLTFGTSSLDTVAYNMLDPTSGNFPGGINTTWSGYARNLYGFLTGRVTNFAGTAYLQDDGKYQFMGETRGGVRADALGFFVQDSWRWKPNLTINAGVRYQVQFPMTTTELYNRPQTWQMVYGITGAGSGSIGQGNLYKPGTLTGTSPLIVPYEATTPRTTPTGTTSRRASGRRGAQTWATGSSASCSVPTRCSAAGTRSASTSRARTSSPQLTAPTPAGPGRPAAARRRAPRRRRRWRMARAAARHRKALPVGFPGVADLPIFSGHQRDRPDPLSGLCRPEHPPVQLRDPAGAGSVHGARHPLRRQHEHRAAGRHGT